LCDAQLCNNEVVINRCPPVLTALDETYVSMITGRDGQHANCILDIHCHVCIHYPVTASVAIRGKFPVQVRTVDIRCDGDKICAEVSDEVMSARLFHISTMSRRRVS